MAHKIVKQGTTYKVENAFGGGFSGMTRARAIALWLVLSLDDFSRRRNARRISKRYPKRYAA